MNISGRDAYMYCDVMALYMGREVAEILSTSPVETLTTVMEAMESGQKTLFNPLSQEWIDELSHHPKPVERLHHYLTTLEDEGQEFRSSFPFYAFPGGQSVDDRLDFALSICDENWMVWKRDIPA